MTNPLLAKALKEAGGNICTVLEELAVTYDNLAKIDETVLDVERQNIRRILLETTYRIAKARDFVIEKTPEQLDKYALTAMEVPGLR